MGHQYLVCVCVMSKCGADLGKIVLHSVALSRAHRAEEGQSQAQTSVQSIVGLGRTQRAPIQRGPSQATVCKTAGN